MTQLDAAASLRGLAVGDAFGSRMALPGDHPDVLGRRPPPSPWQWSDDTEMACSVLSVLTRHGEVEQDALAASFAERYDASRGYGSGAERMLLRYRAGEHWADVAPAAFGTGSWGNGGAMRVAPLGAWFGHDLDLAAAQAARSAVVTHAHPEGIAGAVAVAVAAAVLTKDPAPHPAELLGIVASRVPAGEVQRGIAVASAIRAPPNRLRSPPNSAPGARSARSTRCRSRCGSRRSTSTGSPTRCGPPRASRRISTPCARSLAVSSARETRAPRSRKTGRTRANRCRRG